MQRLIINFIIIIIYLQSMFVQYIIIIIILHYSVHKITRNKYNLDLINSDNNKINYNYESSANEALIITINQNIHYYYYY